jgi:hypothetical protein
MADKVKSPKVTIKHVQGRMFDVFHDKVCVGHTWQTDDGKWWECPAGNEGDVRAVPSSGLAS